MKTYGLIRILAGCLAGWLALSGPWVHAQGFGGGGGAQGQRSTGTTGVSSRDYPNNTLVGDAVISIDPETRKIIVVTDDDTNTKISEVIKKLDHPRPQVLIKVVFLEITHNNTSDVGVEGGVARGFGGGATSSVANVFGTGGLGSASSNATLNALGQNVQKFTPVPPGSGVYQILGADYQVAVRAIATAGKAEVLSRPSILARNNQPATISLGQQVPLVSNTRFDAVNGQINTVTYQNVGIILQVTPFITSDGMVEMIVHPETSSLADQSQWVPISSGASAPVINSRYADTVAVVPDRQTVIIGGLMQTEINESESKVPLLGDIPWLGQAFKRSIKSKVKTELMIFLTPTIIAAPQELAALTPEEREKALLTPKMTSQEDLDKFLDSLPVRPVNPKVNASKKKKN